MAGSNINTYGVNAGFRRPTYNGGYINQPIYNQAGSRGNSYSHGPYAPKTWAMGNSRVNPYGALGTVNAGFQGMIQIHSSSLCNKYE